MSKFQARAVSKGDFDGIREQIREVMKQPGYDDGRSVRLTVIMIRLAYSSSMQVLLDQYSLGMNCSLDVCLSDV
jgi:hypothetical protein